MWVDVNSFVTFSFVFSLEGCNMVCVYQSLVLGSGDLADLEGDTRRCS